MWPRSTRSVHLAVEKGEQQRADMRPVDVGVGHDDDAVIAQLVDVVFVLAEAGSQRRDERDDFLRADQLLEPGALDIEDLAAERKDRLELAVASLLGGPSRRIALDQIQLAQRGIALLAVGELAWQAHAVQHALAARKFARLARCFAGTRGIDDLAADDSRIGGIFEQELVELAADHVLNDRLHFGRHELVLGLRRELGLRHLDRQHAGQALAHIVAGGLDLRLLGELLLLDVAVEACASSPGATRSGAYRRRAAECCW